MKKELQLSGESALNYFKNVIMLSNKKNHNKLTITMTPEIIIKIPAILFTHFSPSKSNFFLKSITHELRDRNHKHEPIKTPATRTDAEKLPRSLPKPSAANIAIKAKILNGLVSVNKKAVRYDRKIPMLEIGILGSLGSLRNILTPR